MWNFMYAGLQNNSDGAAPLLEIYNNNDNNNNNNATATMNETKRSETKRNEAKRSEIKQT